MSYDAIIRHAVEDGHERMMRSPSDRFQVYIAPCLKVSIPALAHGRTAGDADYPQVYIGACAPGPQWKRVLRAELSGALTMGQNLNVIRERMRSVPLYASSFVDSVGYPTIESSRELEAAP